MGREKRENIEGQRLCVQAPIEGVCVPASARPAGSLLVFVSARRHVGASTESKSFVGACEALGLTTAADQNNNLQTTRGLSSKLRVMTMRTALVTARPYE